MPEYFTGTVCLKSVTRNLMSSVPEVFSTLPFSTMPPRRKRSSARRHFAGEIAMGSKKSITLASKRLKRRATPPTPTPARMPATIAMRLWRGVTEFISMRLRASCFALASELSASTRFSTTTPKPSANAGQRYLP